MTDTATVQTLTAEVRTLMVGKRQVTLSVAKQLDTVPLLELDIMGRIHLGRENPYVIGSHHGKLACARWEDPQHIYPRPAFIELPNETITACSRLIREHNSYTYLSLKIDEKSFDVAKEVAASCGIEEHDGWEGKERCKFWTASNIIKDSIRTQIANHELRHAAKVAKNEEAKNSDLIVLAGLR